MHELSIAESVVRIAERNARGRRVLTVELRIGHLRQVVPDALEFAFALVAEGTLVEGAELRVDQVAAAGDCRTCGATTPLPEFPLSCRRCGGLDVDVTRGEELSVDSLELEEQGQAAMSGG